jgi:predicted DsbA family dithiol-disulfide isomerase
VSQGSGARAVERLFAAYFCEGQRVSDHATLRQLGDELGRLRRRRDAGTADEFVADVRGDEADAVELGISGVPSLLLDQRFMINGAVGTDEMLSVLERAWSRRAVL